MVVPFPWESLATDIQLQVRAETRLEAAGQKKMCFCGVANLFYFQLQRISTHLCPDKRSAGKMCSSSCQIL